MSMPRVGLALLSACPKQSNFVTANTGIGKRNSDFRLYSKFSLKTSYRAPGFVVVVVLVFSVVLTSW